MYVLVILVSEIDWITNELLSKEKYSLLRPYICDVVLTIGSFPKYFIWEYKNNHKCTMSQITTLP